MVYLQNQDLQSLIKAISEMNNALATVCEHLERDDWITTAEAGKISGLTPRQCRYRAETGKWKFMKRGQDFLYYAPDVLRESRQAQSACSSY